MEAILKDAGNSRASMRKSLGWIFGCDIEKTEVENLKGE